MRTGRARARLLFVAAAALPACDGAPTPATYEYVEPVLREACAASSVCHGNGTTDPSVRAHLVFPNDQPLTTVLSGVAACEYDLLPRVDPGDPDGSWLMIKLTADFDADGAIQFTPAPDWTPDPGDDCPRYVKGELSFGSAMPLGPPSMRLSDDEIDLMRRWILAGAPGPVE
jgi:hypothetical protein